MGATEKILDDSRILCVDDEPFLLTLLRDVLIHYGAHVAICGSAEEGIALLKNERFDVVISDLSMPGLDGYDLVHALREMEVQDLTRHATPTIAVSGDALRPSRKRRYADFQVYMQKPFDQPRLLAVIERLLEADSEVVKFGSLGSWEAEQATKAAGIESAVAATATVTAANAVAAAADATTAAANATAAAAKARVSAAEAEKRASAASAIAPLPRL